MGAKERLDEALRKWDVYELAKLTLEEDNEN
jgi:hypothetical protein